MTTPLQNQFPDPATSNTEKKETGIGSVFVSNYPPYSFWSESAVQQAMNELNRSFPAGRPLGLYLHIPFCRKRCKFCYFKVYTGKNSGEIQTYLDALSREIDHYAEYPAVQGRQLKYIYFGGGTPSFISVKHLKELVARAKAAISWDNVEEIAFECEPGTLTQSKLEAIKEIGVTRLSLGIEHFNDTILAENGRAHLSKEIERVKPWVEAQEFDQVNIDLIAGMVGDTFETWKETVEKAIEWDADSITVYQLELPHNAVYSRSLREGGMADVHIADWQTKREWHDYAFQRFVESGYEISSAYTVIKSSVANKRFVYRDALWKGSDMLPTGVASFGHINGVHFQNISNWDQYISMIDAGNLPISRAYATNDRERLIREMILQLKLGRIQPAYFDKKFNVNIVDEFAAVYRQLEQDGMLSSLHANEIVLSRAGLLRVDQLLPRFYDEKFRNARYT